MHSTSAVAKIPSIGMLPVWKVGGIGRPVCLRQTSVKLRSASASLFAIRPVYTFFVEVTKEDYVVVNFFPLDELGDQLLKENGSGGARIAKGGKVLCVLVFDGGSC